MMKTTNDYDVSPKYKVKVLALSIAFALSCAAVQAGGFQGKYVDEVDLEDFECEDCPEILPWDWTLIPSLGYLDNPAPRFERYSGIDDGAQLFLNGWTSLKQEDGFYWNTNFHGLGLDSGGLTTELGRQSEYRLSFTANQLAVVQDDYLSSPFNVSGNQLTLPATWARTNNSFVPSNNSLFRSLELGTDWQTIGLSFEWQNESNLSYELDYRQLNKEGQREYSVGQMLNATYIPMPVNNDTEDLTATVSWFDDHWYVSASGFVSRFDNDISGVVVDYPFIPLTTGSEQIQFAGAPQNVYSRYALDLRYRYASRSQFKVRYSAGSLEQDEPLLGYSLNSLFQSALPTDNLNAEVTTSDLSVQWLHQLGPDLRVQVKYRDRERDNETLMYEWDKVVTDLYVAGTVMNLPYDYSSEALSVGASLKLAMGHRLNLTFSSSDRERTLQKVSENSEEGYEFTYHGRFDNLSLNFLVEQFDRDSSEKSLVDYLGVTENPLLSRFNVADRVQNRYRIQGTYALNDRINLAFNTSTNEQEYRDTQIGLTENIQDSMGVDLSWQLDDTTQVGFYYQAEQLSTGLLGSQAVSTSDWFADSEDEVDSYGFHIAMTELNETEMSLRFSLNQSDATSNLIMNQVAAVRNLPEINSDWSQATIELNYPVDEQLTWIFKYHFEDFSSSDYALEGILPADSLRILTMGGLSEQHQVNYLQVSVLYSFSE
jgi:MtrB/PioB family decaheme-associated outer membrane protein